MNASTASVALDAEPVGARADQRHGQAAHAPREAHHQRRDGGGAAFHEGLRERDADRQRRLQQQAADRQHRREAEGGRRGATAMNGTAAISDQTITRRAPMRSASGPPRNPPMPLANRYSDTAALASAIVKPCSRQQRRRERHEAVGGGRAQHDREIEQRQRHGGRTQRRPGRSFVRWRQLIGGTCRSVHDNASRPGIMMSGDQCRPM